MNVKTLIKELKTMPQREIKFRAWDKVYGGWSYFTLKDIKDMGDNYWRFDHWTQYIGRKDKNGKDIYEGDIVKAYKVISNFHMPHLNEYVPYIAAIEWFEDESRFDLNPCQTKDIFEASKWNPIYDMEVIGDIYKNPDILEVGR